MPRIVMTALQRCGTVLALLFFVGSPAMAEIPLAQKDLEALIAQASSSKNAEAINAACSAISKITGADYCATLGLTPPQAPPAAPPPGKPLKHKLEKQI